MLPITPLTLQVYPRGFLGRPLPTSVQKKEIPFSLEKNRRQFSLQLFDNPVKTRLGNPEVEKIFSEYIRAEGKTESRVFRERIFKAAMDLFSARDFYFWYKAQRASPLFGDYQKRFLEDTLGYLKTGTRALSTTSWLMLLSNLTDIDDPEPDAKIVADFFGNTESDVEGTLPKNRDIVDVLQIWWSHPNGIGDLLYTLHILFGNID